MALLNGVSGLVLPGVIFAVVISALRKKTDGFSAFSDGVKESLGIICDIFPNVFTLMIAIGMFRESGLSGLLIKLMSPLLSPFGIPSEIVPAAVLRPLSGSGSLALLADILKSHNPDSLIGIMACVIMGSTETTFYTIAVYMGAAEIRDLRYTVKSALVADLVSIVTAVVICRLLFG